jgi:septal ring factor EnvC (AmiA/AmiB activator)
LRTSLFNIVRGIGADVSNIEHPQDRLFEQQQPQLTQAEQERLLTNLPVEIENLEKQTRETKNDKQLLKNLIDSQSKLDEAIFAGERACLQVQGGW